MQDLAVIPLLSPDSDTDSDSDTHSTDSEPRIACEHTSDCANYNKLQSVGSTGTRTMS